MLSTQRQALSQICRSEAICVNAVIQTDIDLMTGPLGNMLEIWAHRDATVRKSSVYGHEASDKDLAGQLLPQADLSPFAPAAKVFDGRDCHVGDHGHPT